MGIIDFLSLLVSAHKYSPIRADAAVALGAFSECKSLRKGSNRWPAIALRDSRRRLVSTLTQMHPRTVHFLLQLEAVVAARKQERNLWNFSHDSYYVKVLRFWNILINAIEFHLETRKIFVDSPLSIVCFVISRENKMLWFALQVVRGVLGYASLFTSQQRAHCVPFLEWETTSLAYMAYSVSLWCSFHILMSLCYRSTVIHLMLFNEGEFGAARRYLKCMTINLFCCSKDETLHWSPSPISLSLKPTE